MQVRLIEDSFEPVLYDLHIAETGLVFSSASHARIVLPMHALRHFSVDGKNNLVKRFVLETADRMYEGTFLRQEDSEEAVSLLRRYCSCYIDIRLDIN